MGGAERSLFKAKRELKTVCGQSEGCLPKAAEACRPQYMFSPVPWDSELSHSEGRLHSQHVTKI